MNHLFKTLFRVVASWFSFSKLILSIGSSILIMSLMGAYQPAYAQANKIIVKPIRIGDHVLSILRAEGFSDSQRESAISQSIGLRKLNLTLDLNYVVKSSQGRLELEFFEQGKSKAYRISRIGKNINVTEFKPPFNIRIRRFESKAYGSVFSTAFSVSKSNWVASRVQDAFIVSHRISELDRGSRLWFEVEKKFLYGQFIRYGEVTAASASFDGDRVEKHLVRLENGSFMVNSSDLQSSRALYSPVSFVKISSLFQPRRKHPVTGRVQAHLGLDFEGSEGDPILAAKSGTVIKKGRHHAAGNFVVLRHHGGYETYYNHLSSIDSKIKIGQMVDAGARLGAMGCTGYCTKPHLHFSVKLRGQIVDPIRHTRVYPSYAKNELLSRVRDRRLVTQAE